MRKVLRRLTSSWILLPVLVLVLGAAVGFAAAALTGGDDSGDDPPSTEATAPAPRVSGPAKPGRSFLTQVIPPPAGSLSGAKPPARIAKLVRSMPLNRKVAQLMMVGFRGSDAASAPVLAQLRRYDWGGLMVAEQNDGGDAALAALINEIQVRVAEAKHVQPLLMITQQGGEFSAIPELPPEVAPAETESIVEGGEEALATGRAFRRLGLNALFAPSLEVGPEDGGAMGVRAYSDEADQVAGYAQATVEAYRDSRMMAAAGRFPGLGAATIPPEEGPPNVGLTVEELRTRDLVPYRAAIRAGLPAVVVGHGLYTTDDFVTPASQSKAIVSTMLRGYLGFRGLAMSDDLTQPAITTSMDVPAAAVASILAGIDMVYVSGDDAVVRATYDALLDAAKKGEIPESRIDEALTRSLVAKNDLGLLTKKVRRQQPAAPVAEAPGTG